MNTFDDEILFCGEKISIPEFKRYDWDKFIDLKFKYTPNHLYIYCSNKQHTFDAIRNGTIHLTKASDFNDPFDCLLRVDNERIKERYLDLFAKSVGCKFHKKKDIHKKISDLYDHLDKSTSFIKAKKDIANNKDIRVDYIKESFLVILSVCYSENKIINKVTFTQNLEKILDGITNEGFSDLLQQQKICCFSTNYKSQLMWSHYANKHKGVCIKYKLPDIKTLDELNRLSDIDRIFWKYILPVAYMHERVDTTQDIKLFLQDVLDIEKQISVYKFGFLSKSWEWRYENEWRYIFPYSIEKYHKNHPLQELMYPQDNMKFLPISSVYLGCKMEKEDRDKVIDAAENNAKNNKTKIEILKGKESNTEYKIDFDSIATVG